MYPRWGKQKLCILVDEQGFKTSASTVGRIIAYLKHRGDLVEPKGNCISAKRRAQRPYAVRKPKDYEACEPGDIVEIDTLDIRPTPGVILSRSMFHNLELFNHNLIDWLIFYNTKRPHFSLGNIPPVKHLILNKGFSNMSWTHTAIMKTAEFMLGFVLTQIIEVL